MRNILKTKNYLPLKIFWIANIVCIIEILLPFFFVDNYDYLVDIIFISFIGKLQFGLLGIMAFILWVYCIVDSVKVNNKTGHLILLIFLSSIYAPFYFYRFYLK